MSVISPIVPTYSSRTPYLTAAEYVASPTGVDVGNLVPGGSTQDNADALTQTIARASGWVDETCRKVLGATLDTQAGRVRVRADGTIRVSMDYTPILEVQSIQIGSTPSTMTALSDLSNVWIDKKTVTVPLLGVPVGPGHVFTVVQYVNGYANSLLAAPAAANATTLTLDSTLGIVPGQQLTIYDPGATEQITVTAVTDSTVTVATGTLSQHAVGVAVAALPPAIKQAAVLLTTALIKTRGADTYVLPDESGEPAPKDGSGTEEELVALELLDNYKRAA